MSTPPEVIPLGLLMKSEPGLMQKLAIVGAGSLVFLAGWGGGPTASNNPPPPPTVNPTSTPNLTPMLYGLSPPCIHVGGLAFTLSVEGQSFASGSIVCWNGSDRPSTFISSSKLTAQIPASDIAAAGTAAIRVFTPADGSLLSTGSPLAIAAGVPPVSVAVDPGGKFAYVVGVVECCGDGFLSTYSINPATGVLTNAVSDMDLGDGARRFVAVDPSGKFVYVTNRDSNNVSMYTTNTTTGALTATGTIAAGTSPSSVITDPSGKFVYVTNAASNSVSMYTISIANGTLTAIGAIETESTPKSIAVHPSEKFVYVTNSGSNSVSMYSIDAATGTLTSVGRIGT